MGRFVEKEKETNYEGSRKLDNIDGFWAVSKNPLPGPSGVFGSATSNSVVLDPGWEELKVLWKLLAHSLY